MNIFKIGDRVEIKSLYSDLIATVTVAELLVFGDKTKVIFSDMSCLIDGIWTSGPESARLTFPEEQVHLSYPVDLPDKYRGLTIGSKIKIGSLTTKITGFSRTENFEEASLIISVTNGSLTLVKRPRNKEVVIMTELKNEKPDLWPFIPEVNKKIRIIHPQEGVNERTVKSVELEDMLVEFVPDVNFWYDTIRFNSQSWEKGIRFLEPDTTTFQVDQEIGSYSRFMAPKQDSKGVSNPRDTNEPNHSVLEDVGMSSRDYRISLIRNNGRIDE
jgi:hypothetical protein